MFCFPWTLQFGRVKMGLWVLRLYHTKSTQTRTVTNSNFHIGMYGRPASNRYSNWTKVYCLRAFTGSFFSFSWQRSVSLRAVFMMSGKLREIIKKSKNKHCHQQQNNTKKILYNHKKGNKIFSLHMSVLNHYIQKWFSNICIKVKILLQISWIFDW